MRRDAWLRHLLGMYCMQEFHISDEWCACMFDSVLFT